LIIPKHGDLISYNNFLLIVKNTDKNKKLLDALDSHKQSYFIDFKDTKIIMQEPETEWQLDVECYKNWSVLLEDAKLKGG